MDGEPDLLPDLLLVKSGGPSVFHEWRDGFAVARPGLTVQEWDDAVDPARVTYVLVGQPVHGRLAGFPRLKAIFSGGAGVDHLVSDPGTPRGLPIIRMAAHETAQTMGEYVCLSVLGLLRQWRRMALAQERAQWDHFLGTRTALTTRVGLMGLGHVGQMAARMLGGLGFPVSGWSLNRKSLPGVECFGGSELDEFLGQADIVVGLLPHTPHTDGLICARTIAAMRPGAALVNAGRGSLVVLPDLVQALDTGRLSAAVLDVFPTEPLPPEDPAWRHPRITVTSHIAGFATRAVRARYVVENMAVLEAGGTPEFLYRPERGY